MANPTIELVIYMCGPKNGVSTQILAEESHATFMHCYGHALNLATADVVWNVKCLKSTLDTTLEVSKLLKYSPRRGDIFEKLKSEKPQALEHYAQHGGW